MIYVCVYIYIYRHIYSKENIWACNEERCAYIREDDGEMSPLHI